MHRTALPLSLLLLAACGTELPADPAPADDEILTPIDEEPAPAPEPEKPVETDCGNAQLDEAELCDGAAPDGLTCRHLGFAGGELGCAATCDALADASCAPLNPTPIAPLGASITDEGAFDEADPTWARPNASCEGGSEGRYFDAFAYVNETGAPQRVLVTAAWGEGNDGFLHAFAYGSDLRFADGCQSGNDDHEGLTGSRLDLQLAAGARITVVASTFAEGAVFGPYAIEVATVEAEAEAPDAPDAPIVPIALPGESILLDGSLSEVDPVFNRPAVSCDAAASDLAAAPVSYELVQVVNDTGAPQRLRAVARYLDGGDGVLQVFDADFDPAAAAPCRAGNDDLDGRADESGFAGVEIDAGEVLSFVVSSASAPAGAWQLEILTEVPDALDAPLVPVGAIGTGVVLEGDLSGAPTWTRVGQSCQTTALGGQAFRAHRIVNDSNDHQHLRITASWGDGDGLLALFTEDFVAGDPSASCLAADDDWSANEIPGAAVLGSRITDVRIEAGQVLVVVASAFSAGAPMSTYDIELFTEDHGDGPTFLEMATDLGSHTSAGVIGAGSAVLVEESGASRLYSAHLMRNHGDHEHGLALTATWADGEDGVLRVHRYDPSLPGGVGELIAMNDDFEGTAQSHISGEELRILDDSPFLVLATGFRGEDPIGAYTLTATTME